MASIDRATLLTANYFKTLGRVLTSEEDLLSEFMYACELGVIEKATEINTTHPKIIKMIPKIHVFYIYLLKNNQEESALWLLTVRPDILDFIFDNTSAFITRFLFLICQKNYIKTVKLITYEHIEHECYFVNSCIWNAIDVAKYINSRLSSPFENSDYPKLFVNTCKMTSDKTAKWLYETFPEIKQELTTQNMIQACGYGGKELAVWLYDKRDRSKEIDFSSLLLELCMNNALDVAEWVLEFENITAVWMNYVFSEVCFRNYNTDIDTAKWVLEKIPTIDITANDNYIFKMACHRGNEPLVKWLLSLNIDIVEDTEMDIIFEMLCYEESAIIASLIAENSTRYYLTIGEDADGSGYVEIVDWGIRNALIPLGLSFDANEDECCVCFETSNMITDCKHHVCTTCMSKVTSCPYCRGNVTGFYIC